MFVKYLQQECAFAKCWPAHMHLHICIKYVSGQKQKREELFINLGQTKSRAASSTLVFISTLHASTAQKIIILERGRNKIIRLGIRPSLTPFRFSILERQSPKRRALEEKLRQLFSWTVSIQLHPPQKGRAIKPSLLFINRSFLRFSAQLCMRLS